MCCATGERGGRRSVSILFESESVSDGVVSVECDAGRGGDEDEQGGEELHGNEEEF